MIRKMIRSLAAAAALLLLTGFGSGAQVYNVVSSPIPPSPDATLENVQKAIMRAGIQLGWQIVPKTPGHAEGILILRTHKAVVDIKFDTKSFSINYRDSVNLDYKDERKTIHSNYNGWIQNLEKAIRIQATVL